MCSKCRAEDPPFWVANNNVTYCAKCWRGYLTALEAVGYDAGVADMPAGMKEA